MPEFQNSRGGLLKYCGGMLIGVALTYAYVRFGYTLPGIVQVGSKVAGEFMISTAEMDLYNPQSPLEQRERALAVVVGQNPDLLIEADRAIGHQLLEEILRRKAERIAKLLKQRLSAFDVALDQPEIRKLYEKKFRIRDRELLKRRMLLKNLQDEYFLHGYLRRKFPAVEEDELLNLVLDVYQTELRVGGNAFSRDVAQSSDVIIR